jgi:hypothetical protein
MSIKITGLDQMTRQLEDAERALRALDGTITTLEYDPGDPTSVQKAIREMESAIDTKVSPYPGNPLVSKIASGLKERYRKAILRRAAERRGMSSKQVSS